MIAVRGTLGSGRVVPRAARALLVLAAGVAVAQAASAGRLIGGSLSLSMGSGTPLVFDGDGSSAGWATTALTAPMLQAGSAFAGTRTLPVSASPVTHASVMIGANAGGAWTGSPIGGSQVVFTGTIRLTGFGGVTIVEIPVSAGASGMVTVMGTGVTLSLTRFPWTAGVLAIPDVGTGTTIFTTGSVQPPGAVSLVAGTRVTSNLADPTFQTWRLDLEYDPATCGDGVVEGLEECDDGNTVDGDGCSTHCLVPVPEPSRVLSLLVGALALTGMRGLRRRGARAQAG